MAKVVSVNLSENSGEKKSPVKSAIAVAEKGLENDAHARGGIRQISLLGIESVNKMIEKGADVVPGSFAENLTTEGVDLLQVDIGKRMQIGQAKVEVSKHGKECPAPCAIFYQVGYCVMPEEGIFVRVIEGGEIKPGDSITILDNDDV
jgi:MOSC domain-containing protein YiiM